MENNQYHKGSFCIYKPMFCQEGYCSECEIYLHRPDVAKSTGHRDGVRDFRKLQEAGARASRS